jgi:hypothetical protein
MGPSRSGAASLTLRLYLSADDAAPPIRPPPGLAAWLPARAGNQGGRVRGSARIVGSDGFVRHARNAYVSHADVERSQRVAALEAGPLQSAIRARRLPAPRHVRVWSACFHSVHSARFRARCTRRGCADRSRATLAQHAARASPSEGVSHLTTRLCESPSGTSADSACAAFHRPRLAVPSNASSGLGTTSCGVLR